MSVYQPQPGDVLACWGSGLISQIIQWGTFDLRHFKTSPAHVALIVPDLSELLGISPAIGEPLVLESTSLSPLPCLFRRERVRGIQLHTLGQWLTVQERVEVFRINDVNPVVVEDATKLARVAAGLVRKGSRYDYRGAVCSATTIFKLLYDSEIDELFCSELVAVCLAAICKFPMLNPHRYTPGLLAREMRRISHFAKPLRILPAPKEV